MEYHRLSWIVLVCHGVVVGFYGLSCVIMDCK